ncbi:MAG: hypothetical protein WCK83_09160 [Burkholderiales bacterium]
MSLSMFSRQHVLAAALAVFSVGNALAADCVLSITRSACPGQEKESFSKCDGKASCDETVPAASASQCTLKAKSACSNKRLDVTKYKKVTAKYDGAPIDGGKDFCVGHPDFPYASKPDCK